jgi:hypothetical protein
MLLPASRRTACSHRTCLQDSMQNADQQSIRQLIAYKRSRDETCLRKSAAHEILYRKLRPDNSKLPCPPRSVLQLQAPNPMIEEASIISLLIDKLLLDDLVEHQRLNCSVLQASDLLGMFSPVYNEGQLVTRKAATTSCTANKSPVQC